MPCKQSRVFSLLLYDLFAVCHHHGAQMSGGHYTAHCRNPIDGQWRHYDDEYVRKVDSVPTEVVANTAYLLFYQRRGSSNARRGSQQHRRSVDSSMDAHWFSGQQVARNGAAPTTTNDHQVITRSGSSSGQQQNGTSAVNASFTSQSLDRHRQLPPQPLTQQNVQQNGSRPQLFVNLPPPPVPPASTKPKLSLESRQRRQVVTQSKRETDL